MKKYDIIVSKLKNGQVNYSIYFGKDHKSKYSICKKDTYSLYGFWNTTFNGFKQNSYSKININPTGFVKGRIRNPYHAYQFLTRNYKNKPSIKQIWLRNETKKH